MLSTLVEVGDGVHFLQSSFGHTCVRALHAQKYDGEANQNGKDEHYDNGHHHTNDESSVIWNRWGWRKRRTLM